MSSIFLAGATGVIGRPLCKRLVEAGHDVTGTTRDPNKILLLKELGVRPVVVDAFDARALHAALLAAQPDVVIHQLTDLPPGLDPAKMAEARVRNARFRVEGTRNLVAAAVAAGAERMIAQSIAFAYAGEPPFTEETDLATDAPGAAGLTARAVENLETQVLEAPLEGVILRYGKLYGPGTGFDAPPPDGPLHVDDAAEAALLAVARGQGAYNIAEDDGAVSCLKAARELGWTPRRT